MVTDIHGLPIEPLWAAEFRGFFLGEGSLEIGLIRHTQLWKGRKGRPATPVAHIYDELRPRARLIQRDDSRAILDAVKARLGGNITAHNARVFTSGGNGKVYENKPTISWYVMNSEGIQRVLDLLKGGCFPHTKLREVAILEEFLRLRPKAGHYWLPEHRARCLELMAAMRKVREYPPTVPNS
ncbi:MAG: hypothetical protein WC869_16610 [Phycisphaerae bacterium]|jgi:hypothetical protein